MKAHSICILLPTPVIDAEFVTTQSSHPSLSFGIKLGSSENIGERVIITLRIGSWRYNV